jgi:multiple sugar transport system ATP-binding protein
MASVHLQTISKSFQNKKAIDHLDLKINDGEFFVLLGPSGAGKTTTLRMIAGLETPDAGDICFDGQSVRSLAPAYRDCAFVFQQYSLYPHLSVYDNLAFPLRSPLLKTAESDIKKRIEEVAALLHIEQKLQRKATALSGGEMQRVAIGRALVRRPKVYLMDEPLSSLDAKLREELRVELRKIQKQTGSTVVYVTHDQVEATTMADRIGILEEGALLQVGTPQDIYNHPQSLNVAQRLGSPAINVMPLEWLRAQHSALVANAPARATHVAVRPEDIRIDATASSLSFKVVECALAKHLLVLERHGFELRISHPMDHSIPHGSELAVSFHEKSGLFFDERGHYLSLSH